MHLIEQLERELGKDADAIPRFNVGDDVEVHYLIREGEKERIQLFVGTVIAIQGRNQRRTMTVRRIVQGEGVERTFPIHSPRVTDVVVTRRGNVRQSKLYYLRDRVGKKTRVKELLGEKVRRERGEERNRRKAQATKQAAAAASSDGAEGEAE